MAEAKTKNPKERVKLLEVKDLVTEFSTEEGVVRAVKSVSFTVYRGETVGIVGESGSGKSVTSLSIMKLIPSPPGKIVSGSIMYYPKDGEPMDLVQSEDKVMQKLRGDAISMIFQEPMTSLNPVFTCGHQVAEALMLHKKLSKSEAKAKTIEMFEKVQLPTPERMFKSYPHQISGGQKQRVMIAMAMCCDPDLLIADEPTTALDVTVQKTILELMNDLSNQLESSIIFITHDLGVIGEIADRVIVMYQGNIVEEGHVLDIFKNPKHPYTRSLLACRPPLGDRLKRLPTVKDFMDVAEDGTIIEKPMSVGEALKKVRISPKEFEARMTELAKEEPILSVKNLKTFFVTQRNFLGQAKAYTKAVNDVSFDVYPGETLGLVGESGCGKTTLGRSLLRLVEPMDGEVIYKGRNIRDMQADELRKMRKEMQLIFQDPYSSLNPRMTIGNAIREPMTVHEIYSNEAERKERVEELLLKVGMLPEHFGRYPHEFSGGQRQRICIARALAVKPEFIVCDESVSALDVSVQAQVLNLLLDLREEFNLTYIFISHDLSVVKFISDRMVVMNAGQIEEYDSSDVIYNNPQKAYTQKLIQAIPKGEVADIERRLKVG